jgi:hypothetical protein
MVNGELAGLYSPQSYCCYRLGRSETAIIFYAAPSHLAGERDDLVRQLACAHHNGDIDNLRKYGDKTLISHEQAPAYAN